MLRSLLLAAVLTSTPPQPADYQKCSTVNTGPIERSDHYSVRPYGRRKDMA
jgi:hypothetical protein